MFADCREGGSYDCSVESGEEDGCAEGRHDDDGLETCARRFAFC